MAKSRNLIIGLIILVILLASMVTYRVRYNEMAILITFGKADQNSVMNDDGQGAGLHFRWPWPIQEVARVYDRRVQILEDELEEQQTLDKQDIIVGTYVVWSIRNPLDFYRTLNTVEQAQRQLRDRLRNARSEIGQYTFSELTNLDPEKLKLAEAEDTMRSRMQQELDNQGFGIDVKSVGIKRIILAEAVSQKVFERMRSTRQRLAQRARSEGDAAASDIRAKAKSAEERILAFADQRAQAIRAEGDAAAAEYYKVFKDNEDFAIFLRKLEEYETILKNNTTFILDAQEGPFDLFSSTSEPKKPDQDFVTPPQGPNEVSDLETLPEGPDVATDDLPAGVVE
jgi:membrane protease subunit HflC